MALSQRLLDADQNLVTRASWVKVRERVGREASKVDTHPEGGGRVSQGAGCRQFDSKEEEGGKNHIKEMWVPCGRTDTLKQPRQRLLWPLHQSRVYWFLSPPPRCVSTLLASPPALSLTFTHFCPLLTNWGGGRQEIPPFISHRAASQASNLLISVTTLLGTEVGRSISRTFSQTERVLSLREIQGPAPKILVKN